MADRIDFPVSKSTLTKRKPCKECGKAIVFVRSETTHRWMALDVASAKPTQDPNWVRLEDHHPHCPTWPSRSGKPASPKTPAPEPKRARAMTQAEEERRDLYGPRD